MCDPLDLHVIPQRKAVHSQEPTIFLYDRYPGGMGLSEQVYREWRRSPRQSGSSSLSVHVRPLVVRRRDRRRKQGAGDDLAAHRPRGKRHVFKSRLQRMKGHMSLDAGKVANEPAAAGEQAEHRPDIGRTAVGTARAYAVRTRKTAHSLCGQMAVLAGGPLLLGRRDVMIREVRYPVSQSGTAPTALPSCTRPLPSGRRPAGASPVGGGQEGRRVAVF